MVVLLLIKDQSLTLTKTREVARTKPLPVRVPRLVLAGVAKQAKKRHRSMYLSLLKTQSNR